MVHPTSGTLGHAVSGEPLWEDLRMKTIDTGYAKPGRLLMRDTDDDHCKVAGAGEAKVIGYLADLPKHNSDDDFRTEHWIRCASGRNHLVWLMATTGQTIVKGALLYPAAHGALKTTPTSTEAAVAKAVQSLTTTTLAEAPILVECAI